MTKCYHTVLIRDRVRVKIWRCANCQRLFSRLVGPGRRRPKVGRMSEKERSDRGEGKVGR